MTDLTGRVALVTGAGRGIGAVIARGLAARGAAVAAVARTRSQLDAVTTQIAEQGGRAIGLAADLGDLATIEPLVAEVTESLGTPDVLVNNAATVDPLSPTPELDVRRADEAIRLNVTALIGLSAAVLPAMLGTGWGRIVNVSSGVVVRPAAMIGATVYAATKGAVETHTLSLAAELAGTGVTVNAYRPGRVDTAMQEWMRSRGATTFASAASFARAHESGELISAETSAAGLLDRIAGDDNGEIWTVGS